MQTDFRVSDFSFSEKGLFIEYAVTNSSYHIQKACIRTKKPNSKIYFHFQIHNKNNSSTYIDKSESEGLERLTALFKKELPNHKQGVRVKADITMTALDIRVRGSEMGCRVVEVFTREFHLNPQIAAQIRSVVVLGTLAENLVYEKIASLVSQGKLQEAFAEASTADQLGFSSALFSLGNHFKALNAIQPAYEAFKAVTATNALFQRAQFEAGILYPQVLQGEGKPLSEIAQQIFTYFMNAGDAGQEQIDRFFAQHACGYAEAEAPEQLSNIRLDFATLSNVASVIRAQNEHIHALEERLRRREPQEPSRSALASHQDAHSP